MSFYYKAVPDGTYCLTGYDGNSSTVEFPTNITVSILGDKLFKNHTELESIEIPSTVTQIGGFVFDGCENLKSIKLPENLDDMWQYALTRMAIETIEIPGSLKEIIPFTFNQCKKLKTVYLNPGTKHIHGMAFKDCTALTDIYIPENTTVHEKAFEGCNEVTIHRNR